MSQNRREIHNILKLGLAELKQIRYTQFTRNKIKHLLGLRSQQVDTLEFRNECYAYHSLMHQQMLKQGQGFKTAKQLEFTMKLNKWVHI